MKKLILLMFSIVLLGSCNKDIEGCTDVNATNYNSDATIDDGSCILPPAQWEKQLNFNGLDYAHSIVQLNSGNYFVAGQTDSYGNGGRDIILIKLDIYGDTIWTKTYGTTQDEKGYKIIICSDGNLAICGQQGNSGYLLKLDTLGNEIWAKNYPNMSYCKKLIETGDGGFCIGGQVSINNNGQIYITKTDGFGNIIWELDYIVTQSTSYLAEIIETNNGDFMIFGSLGYYGEETLLWNLSSSGILISENIIQNTFEQNLYSAVELADGDFLIGADVVFDSIPNTITSSFKISKFSSVGQILWTKYYGNLNVSTNFFLAENMQITSSNNIVLIGLNYFSGANGNNNIMFLKVDESGNEILFKEFTNSLQISLQGNFINTNDDGFAIVGSFNDNGNRGMYLLKTDIDGNY